MADEESQSPPSDSILNVTKKMLNVPIDYDAFDIDIITHINSVFATLRQLGVGPETTFSIEDAMTPWGEFIAGDLGIASVKSYMVNKVRLMFDPPTSGFTTKAIQDQIAEFEWRLNVASETP